MALTEFPSDGYLVKDADGLMTPALLIYPEIVDANIKATLRMVGNDPNRWRPHVKTAKIGAVIERLISNGVRNFKCSTTLELDVLCRLGASDALLAFSVVGSNAQRVVQLARQFPQTRVSVLIESPEQAASWRETGIGIFIDVNSGMNRTGISPERIAEIVTLAKQLGNDFRGLHFYDGQISAYPIAERERQAYMGYDRLMTLLEALEGTAVRVREVITSGTPAAPFGYSYRRFQQTGFVHRISPGTVVYNDTTSLEQLPAYGFRPAAVVLSTVISRPLPDHVTCDAGHKSVSADAGVPTCLVLGHAELEPLKPSEEHLPLRVSSGHRAPEIGDKLYLLPRHVCPSVNNFDDALFIRDQTVSGVERVSARGHENPLAAVKDPVAAAG